MSDAGKLARAGGDMKSLRRWATGGSSSAVTWLMGTAVLIYAIALYCSLRGINFGNHPDEWKVLKSIEDSFRSGIFLQRWYEWGSLGYDTGALTAMLSYLERHDVRDAILQTLTLAPIETPVGFFRQHGSFHLLVRSIDAIISLLVVFPVAHLSWRLTKRLWPSILSTIVVGLSFQLNYHTRWFVGDAPMMMFGFLSVYLGVIFYQSAGALSTGWLAASAIAAAFSASAKYTGGMFLIAPAMAAALKIIPGISPQWTTVRKQLLQLITGWIICCLAFGLTFVLLNPAAFAEPFVFFGNLEHMQHLYANGVGTNQDVTSRPENVLLSLLFTFIAAPSPYLVLSLIAVVLFCLGFWKATRRGPELPILVLPFVLFFCFLAWQKVFVARNLLPMLPFVAVMCGIGARNFAQMWPRFRPAVPLLCLVFLVANGSYVWLSAREINRTSPKSELAAMQGYIERRPETAFSIDQSVSKYDPQILNLSNARPLDQASPLGDFIAIDANEFRNSIGGEHRHCSTNRPGIFTMFGPRDSSFDYYTGMIGAARYILIDRNTYQQVLDRTPYDGLICWPLMRLRWVY